MDLSGFVAQGLSGSLDAAAYERSDILGYIASAELAISRFEQADVNAKRGFAAHVLFPQRAS